MVIESANVILYTLAFVVPGFMIWSIASRFVPREEKEENLSIVRFLYLSAINYAVWSWLIYLAIAGNISKQNTLASMAVYSWVVLVGPIVVGMIWGIATYKDWARKVLQRLGVNPVHGIPTAWDYKFSKTGRAVWVLVTMNDGSAVAGLFGSNSFAGSSSSERDLYIEQVYKITNGTWERVGRGDGVLIRGDCIKHIEFWHDEEVSNE